jgi:trans-AT polyketide synthase/acyltransferase/oxidoreductase domain-containing protein
MPVISCDKCPKGIWRGDLQDLQPAEAALEASLAQVGQPLYVVQTANGKLAVSHYGTMQWGNYEAERSDGQPLIAFAPPLRPRDLGAASFKQDLGLRYAYLVGAMANGITSVEMVSAAGRAGMLGFFGAGGLSLDQINAAIDQLQAIPADFPYGFNLIHSPNNPRLEMETVALYLQKQIRLVSASAYLGLTLPLVYYRVKGIHQTDDGRIICPNHVVAKVSRMEVASKFLAFPPQNMLRQLVQQGLISDMEARLSQNIPMAQDITAEADSGGHTDNRPALTLLPNILAVRDQAQRQYGFTMPLRVGLGGGIATPESVCAAFAMGAAYVLTGSINQAALEADTSQEVKEMLAQAQQADVTMAPAADMFELGAKVQVLKRGTMFAMRGTKLYELYRTYDHYSQIPEAMRTTIEKDMLRCSFDEAWSRTRDYFATCDPRQIERAEKDPKHKMALIFRSYLGQASLWAKKGIADRKIDYQIWCGPAMGAFNAWVKGSFLENVANRGTEIMAMNLLYGASRMLRMQWLSHQGVDFHFNTNTCNPLSLQEIEARLG